MKKIFSQKSSVPYRKKAVLWLVVIGVVACAVLAAGCSFNAETKWNPQTIKEDYFEWFSAVQGARKEIDPTFDSITVKDLGDYKKTAAAWMNKWLGMYESLPKDSIAYLADSVIENPEIKLIADGDGTKEFIFRICFSVRPTYPIEVNGYWLAGCISVGQDRNSTWGRLYREVHLKLMDDGLFHFQSMATGGGGADIGWDAGLHGGYVGFNLSPIEIIRQELHAVGADTSCVFLLPHGVNSDGSESVTVYADYILYDVMFSNQYYLTRAAGEAAWQHSKPTGWKGTNLSAAAREARKYFTKKYDIRYFDSLWCSWAQVGNIEKYALAGSEIAHFAAFHIGKAGGTPILIVVGSVNGRGNWEVLYDETNSKDWANRLSEINKQISVRDITAQNLGDYEKTAYAWMDAWLGMYKSLPEDSLAHISDGAVDRLTVKLVSSNVFVFEVDVSVRPTSPLKLNNYWLAGNIGASPNRDNTWGQIHREIELRLMDDGLFHLVDMGAEGVGFNKGYVPLSSAAACTLIGNTKIYSYTGRATAEGAASSLAMFFMEDLKKKDYSKSFRVTEYRNLSVTLIATQGADQETRTAYHLREDEISPNTWLAEISVEYKYDGVLAPTGISSGEWNSGGKTGFLLTKDGDNYTLQSRHETANGGDNAAKILNPMEIIRQKLTMPIVNYVFLLSQGVNSDGSEFATVYASYTPYDWIYRTRYDFTRESGDAEWKYSEKPWEGISIDTAANFAKRYFANEHGISINDVSVNWAQVDNIEKYAPAGSEIAQFAAFYVGETGDAPIAIIVGSPDGQSNWEFLSYEW